ncbi:MAG TPA: hypothetical protein VJ801_07310 [Polyangia bacterium]|jgi:hypothetical protein|nr:hypothetical protein [Polyangia bacterium]
MNGIGKVSTAIVVLLALWVAANWDAIKTAYKYRAQISAAAQLGADLQSLGVLK